MARAGPTAVIAATAAELSSSPCLCSAFEASSLQLRRRHESLVQSKHRPARLSRSFASDFPLSKKSLCNPRGRSFIVAAELGGQYEEGFEDVHLVLSISISVKKKGWIN